MTTVNDDNVGDFTNDLASDVGPLLALFGEKMTIQYLSESTSFLDYFIFSMGPIGIITGIVSAIRLCGHTSLRAFVGRSQEGEGAIEAELCTSTSRDVCELFTKGGVQRVLGRPSILELVYVESESQQSSQQGPQSNEEVGLYLSRNYFEDRIGSENAHWKRVSGNPVAKSGEKSNKSAAFAPNPNLSLNVGVRKQAPWIFWTIAAIGLVLQCGVVALAGVGVWILGWNLNEAEGSAKNYAPSMYITGTVMLCFGMWSCAALIGQTTDEIRFKRLDSGSSHRPRLLWLQPGPQVIGDQSFDPFAYSEDTEKDALRVWTSSSKRSSDIFELYTVFAVGITLVGYVVQFIGLRGMKGWVSLAQLGITIIMSLLRGLLRFRRLRGVDNRLGAMPDLVAGHELDWLASDIVSRKPQGDFFWHVTGQYKDARIAEETSTPTESRPKSDEEGSRTANSSVHHEKITRNKAEELETQTSILSNHLFRSRVRLAHLTGNISFRKLDDAEYQIWKDEYVNVRAKARKVASAICTAAANLAKERHEQDLVLCVGASSIPKGNQVAFHKTQTMDITLKPPAEFSTAGWRMDSAQLEAALGLWMWAMVSDERLLEKDNDNVSQTLADKLQPARMISAGPDNDSWDVNTNIQSEMNLWLGGSATTFREAILMCSDQSSCGLATLFEISRPSSSEIATPKENSVSELTALDLRDKVGLYKDVRRFCGWGLVHSKLSSSPNPSYTKSEEKTKTSYSKLRIQLSDLSLTKTSLLDLCAQELFTALMLSLAGVLPLDDTKLAEDSGHIRLENESVNIFVNAFQEADLGASSDAMLCVVPALRRKLTPLDPERLLSALCNSADNYRQASEWQRAENVLTWACKYFAPQKESRTQRSRLFLKALLDLAELYRWSLVHMLRSKEDPSARSRQTFGMNGIKTMMRTYGKIKAECQSVLDRYWDIAQRLETDTTEGMMRMIRWAERENELLSALCERDRTKALYELCFVTPQMVRLNECELASTLPLAVRNDWSEVVKTLLEMGANTNVRIWVVDPSTTNPYQPDHPDNPDHERTALSYCAELGQNNYIQPLLEHGAAVDEPAGPLSRSPLSYTARYGQLSTMKLLLASPGHVNVDMQDKNGVTSLALAAENGHVDVVHELLSRAVNIDTADDSGWTPLMKASYHGHQEIVQQLLAKGARLDLKNNYGESAHSIAARAGHVRAVETLLDHGADIEARDNHDQTALSSAVMSGQLFVAKSLLDRGADIESKDANGYTALLSAVLFRKYDLASLLAERGANTRYVKPEQNFNTPSTTPLHKAIELGERRLVELLIDKGADLEWNGDKSGYTALLLALQDSQPDEEMAPLLIRRGADVTAVDKFGFTVLYYALHNRNTKAIPLILERDVDVNKYEALYWAVNRGYTRAVRTMLDKGADPNPGKNGKSHPKLELPLCEAVRQDYTEIVSILLEKGADPNYKNFFSRSPGALAQAATKGHAGCLRLLLVHGAKIDEQRGDHLHCAILNGHIDCLQMMVEHGANLEARDEKLRTPLEVAINNCKIDAVRLLVEKGALVNNGSLVLHNAAKLEQVECMRFLLERGAQIDFQDMFQKQTPLHAAAEEGKLESVRTLVEAGAKLEVRDLRGRTALHVAATAINKGPKEKRKACVLFLMEKGAILDTKDDSGESAATWVERDYEPA